MISFQGHFGSSRAFLIVSIPGIGAILTKKKRKKKELDSGANLLKRNTIVIEWLEIVEIVV